jgi:hypothetical protein
MQKRMIWISDKTRNLLIHTSLAYICWILICIYGWLDGRQSSFRDGSLYADPTEIEY